MKDFPGSLMERAFHRLLCNFLTIVSDFFCGKDTPHNLRNLWLLWVMKSPLGDRLKPGGPGRFTCQHTFVSPLLSSTPKSSFLSHHCTVEVQLEKQGQERYRRLNVSRFCKLTFGEIPRKSMESASAERYFLGPISQTCPSPGT